MGWEWGGDDDDNFVKHLIDTMNRKRQPDTIPSQN